MAEYVTVAKKDELKPGECKVVEAKDKTLALYNVDGTYYATDNTCLHRGGPLGDGDLDGRIITCPWHGWEYDVTTGENTFDPSSKVEPFEVKIDGQNVQVKI
ncbi:Rieske 2Fe-2S domain-containing protein [candidate division KSB1 bacterium]|nr:Rieske 2Fe-2S domain-containing protein [candidate division KSB1 bacterium]NIR71395.1 Rieske 2Fe-2S domain-containing protein [candidate division KSB1 bacterium]NIS26289.1 Rieske 2Fe-2S domain-containing protein [candidate division KSB1 bacterium]NIT73051.1 Rieske 2Fe-2S domain-containing protein [candidate division KSB1 bacterium]NIU26959.1 Rieske 2Fe-2S domain-containing protein [candidate division KSB1 bacterium]